MGERSFKTKIIIPAVIVLVALVVALNVFLYIGFSVQRDNLVSQKLTSNSNSLKLYLDNSKAATRAAAVSMALYPDVIKAVRERSTDELLQLFNPKLSLYQITYFTICDNEGTVLARTHEPDTFGDSVLGQQNIKDALAGKVSTYFESGTMVMVSMRSGSPVYDADGSLLGAISAGIRFDTEDTVEELKRLFDSEVAFFLGNTRIAATITRDEHRIVGTTLDPHIAETVIKNKREYSGEAEILGEKYKTFYMPLLNAQGEAFAIFSLGIPEAQIAAASNKSIRDGILFGLGGLVVSIVLLFIIISSISKPITQLSGDMDKLAGGNLGIQISVKSNDEVGRLAMSIQKTADTLHKLHEDISAIISEHEKGNTDYYFKTDEFSGDYKTLAQSVLKVASFSMTDQLTGLANRRSFENRLGLEWKTAIQKSSPISVLVINIDQFKQYCDKYGHQQGDEALKAAAAVLKRLARPSLDIVARFEGDEFIILLPGADSNSAMDFAKKICAEAEKMLIPGTELEALKITLSIGVSSQTPTQGKMVEHFITTANRALVNAKEAGRNSVAFTTGE